jgi:N-acetylmuramoyl-L-alanine amidase
MLLLVLFAAVRGAADRSGKDVYAAVDSTLAQKNVPPGISGMLSGVQESKDAESKVERIGTSCEEVIVGQRTRESTHVTRINAGTSVRTTVEKLNEEIYDRCRQASIMSDEDYETLLAIVEAEAGGEDFEGRVMVANVIMNRVDSDHFPDSVTEVVWDQSDGAVQFSPTEDGRIYTVTVSDTTKKAVKAAIEGTDYSRGALFFVAKDQANQEDVKWFDADLKCLFEHGVHTFYTYSDE